MKATTLALLAVIPVFAGVGHAQSATATTGAATATTQTTSSSINERKVNQQDRIAQGLKSGQLTAGEASSLEKQEAGINTEEKGMREQDNGKLTAQDKKTLTAQQNVESKDIYQDKHNSAVQKATNGEVNDRLANQQDRIANGIKDDKLSDMQVAHLEKQETGINKEETGMREQDNGKLTAQDKKTLNHQLNQESRRINRDERRTSRRK